MSDPVPAEKSATPRRSNRPVVVVCLTFLVAMLGMSYAAVPLYDLFCRVTGYGGTTQRVTQYSEIVLDREVTVRFDANVAAGLPWQFRPVAREVKVKIGETAQASYAAKNVFSQPTSGRATFNVTPQLAGAYFMKVECFCFTDNELAPGETMDMPVVFYVDPAIVEVPELKNINTITLSYTFFPIDDAGSPDQAAAAGKTAKTDKKLGG